jgi:hypothetical protein
MLASESFHFGWLVRVLVSRSAPRQSFGFAFVGDPRQNERMMAGLGEFHRIPLPLLTDSIHPARFSVDRHSIDDPLLFLRHQAPLPPQETTLERFDFWCSLSSFIRIDLIPLCTTVHYRTNGSNNKELPSPPK